MPLLAILNPRPTPRGTAHPLQRLLGPIRWEDMSKAQRLQVERQFIGGGMPYNPSGTYWSLMKYPKQVGGFRLWKQVQFLKNGSCCRNPKGCGHNKRVRKNSLLPMIAGGVAAGVSGAVANRFLRNGKTLSGIAPDGTKYVVKKDREWDEWQVVAYVKGKRHEGRTYHASDKADAVGTFYKIVGKQVGHVQIGGPDIISFDMGGGVRFNRNRKRRVHRNPGAAQSVISVPFRQGRKYSVTQVQNWVERHGTPAMKKRFVQAMAQYRRFHKGSLPKYITYSLYKMGSHKGISDVEFGVSEGREWMAAYQVPRSSGKWMDKASGGRYVHAHGDSDIEVDIKRPVKLSKLPLRFHTPDGKAVGVIPSKNVKIGEWYEG